MIGNVYEEFIRRRADIAKVLGIPLNLTGMYHVQGGVSGTYYSFHKMLVPYKHWDAGIAAYQLGYNSNHPIPPTAAIRTYFPMDGMSHLAAFYLDGLPGCCGAAHLHDMFSRNYGMGKIMLEMSERAAYFNGFRLLTGTVIEKNVSSLRAAKLIDKYGWQRNRSFVNNRTKNTVYLCSKELTADNAGRRIGDGTGKNSNQSNIREVTTLAGGAGFRA